MVYAFECERCQIRVYSAGPNRARGCPVCAEPMDGAPVVRRGGERVAPAPSPLDPRAPGPPQPA
jgi:hypothetical protein